MGWWRRKEREHDLERELQSDLELEALEQQESGLSAEEARYAAKRALGNASRKFSISMRRAASPTATAMRLTNPSVRSARQDDTSSAAASLPS